MRMRTKKWARPELAACEFYKPDGAEFRGKWQTAFLKPQPIWLELGCGKGGFLSQCATANLDKNFIAIDLSSDMLGLSKRNVERAFDEIGLPVTNVCLTWQNIERISLLLAPTDQVERIFINFCNPWFKTGQYKKRLTHSRQLAHYKEFLVAGGEIHFKTDDDELFAHSQKYFTESGFEITYITSDLHESGYDGSYPTEHEQMYTQQGIKTKFLIARQGLKP